MSTEKSQNEERKLPGTKDFGMFYPVGYLVVGFPNRACAYQIRQDLLADGYEQSDCPLLTSDEIADYAKHNLEKRDKGFAGFLAGLGKSHEFVQTYLDAARDGVAFLVVHAPGNADVDRAMAIIRRERFVFAHRYRHFAIEELA